MDRRVFAYDNIGNRDTYTTGTGAQTSHQNPLRQQAVTRRPPGPLPAAGSRQRRAIVETASSPVTGQNMLYDADGNVTESYVVGDSYGVAWAGWAVSTCPCVREARRCRERPISPAAAREGDPEFDERATLQKHGSAAHVFRN
ncbi:MAG: hypothetical protein IT450_10530 [Phycisphaerales bacterium]|nr:hypothetical protein [Phycisphaerales bacterium]